MRPIVLTFSGGIGSGKTSISEGVSLALGWKRASFGDYVRAEAIKKGIGEEREALQDLGESFIQMGWETFVLNVLSRGGWKPDESLVVDGIRHVMAFQTIQRVTFPSLTFLIHVETGRSVRIQRLSQEGITERELRTYESHSTEQQVPKLLAGLADLTVDGSQETTTNVGVVVDWIRCFQPSAVASQGTS